MEQAADAARPADLLIRGTDWLITVDGERRVIRDAGIAVSSGRFAAVGKSADIERAWRAGRVIEGRGTVVVNGRLVEGHHVRAARRLLALADMIEKLEAGQ